MFKEKKNHLQKEIKTEINKCKERYKQKIENHFYYDNMQETWKRLKTVSNYTKIKVNCEIEVDVDKLNEFHARLDVEDNEGKKKKNVNVYLKIT